MGLTLDVLMRLDTASFTTKIGSVVQAIQSSIQFASGVGDRIKTALDLGGSLSDIAQQIQESAGEVMILQRAFEDAGMSAEDVAGTIAKMRKAIGGTDEFGNSTAKAFDKIGLSVKALMQVSAREQLTQIGAAIMALGTASERAAAVMEVFGRSGARMLTLFSDRGAFEEAIESLHSVPDTMNRAAGAFDKMSDRINNIKKNMSYFWVGFSEQLLPELDKVTKWVQGIDFSEIGSKIASSVRTGLNVIANGNTWELISSSFELVTIKIENAMLTAFANIQNALTSALLSPLQAFSLFAGATFDDFLVQYVNPLIKLRNMLFGDGLKFGVRKVMFGEEFAKQASQKDSEDEDRFAKMWAEIYSGKAFGSKGLGVEAKFTEIYDKLRLDNQNSKSLPMFEYQTQDDLLNNFLEGNKPVVPALKDTALLQGRIDTILKDAAKRADDQIKAVEAKYPSPSEFLGDGTGNDYGRVGRNAPDMQSDALTRVGGSMGAVFAPNMYRIAVETNAIMQTVAQNTAALVGQGRSTMKASYG